MYCIPFLATAKSDTIGSEVQGGKTKPLSLDPSSRITSSRLEIIRSETGAIKENFEGFEGTGHQFSEIFKFSANDNSSLHFDRNLALSSTRTASLAAAMKSSAARMAFPRASSLVRERGMRDSISLIP